MWRWQKNMATRGHQPRLFFVVKGQRGPHEGGLLVVTSGNTLLLNPPDIRSSMKQERICWQRLQESVGWGGVCGF